MVKYYYDRIFEELIYLKGQLFKKKLFNPSQGLSESPFFIISPGRSGSTFLRKLLMLDEQINIPPESYECIPKSIKFYILNDSIKWKKLVDFAAMWMNVKFARLEVDYLKLRGPRTKLQRQQSA